MPVWTLCARTRQDLFIDAHLQVNFAFAGRLRKLVNIHEESATRLAGEWLLVQCGALKTTAFINPEHYVIAIYLFSVMGFQEFTDQSGGTFFMNIHKPSLATLQKRFATCTLTKLHHYVFLSPTKETSLT